MCCIFNTRSAKPSVSHRSLDYIVQHDSDLDNKSMDELLEIIYELKTKHYSNGGTTKEERLRWIKARRLYMSQAQAVPCVNVHLKS